MKFNIITFGCKVNQYESNMMKENMLSSNFFYTEDLNDANIIIVNTCSVTNVADKKCLKMIRRLKREYSNAILVVAGCSSQNKQSVYENLDIDILIGNRDKSIIDKLIKEYIETEKKYVKFYNDRNLDFEDMYISDYNHTRAFIKIEDGCDNFCSYCIIPYARGRVRSRKLDDIKNEVTSLAKSGYSEIVLVGINLSCYGTDIGSELCDAVDAVCEVDGIERVRLGSLEPELMSIEVLNRLNKQAKFCPQFHLSLQSGCDETLKRMNRKYTTEEYAKIVDNIRSIFDNSSITTDIMTGFPGETEEEFEKSCKFAEKIAFAKAHIFPYSRREGTVADKAPNQIPNELKKERANIMIDITEKTRQAFMKSQIGLIQEVLLETRTKDDMLEGYTKNYTPVLIEGDKDMCGKIVKAKIEKVDGEYCIASII